MQSSSPWCPSCPTATEHGRGSRANKQAVLHHDSVEMGFQLSHRLADLSQRPWSLTSWGGDIQQAIPSGLTHRNTGVYSSKIPCQPQVHGSTKGVPKPPANSIQDSGHIAPFKFTAESPWPHDLRPCCSSHCPATQTPTNRYPGALGHPFLLPDYAKP